MFKHLKLLSLFLFVINCCSSSFAEEDTQLNKLVDCLELAGVSSKNIHRSTDPEYVDLNFQWNTLYGYLTPLVYLVATSASDVQQAVICSRSTGIRIVPRSGGHSYVKNSFGDSRSLIVDVASINEITVDPVRMTSEMGAGARNGQVTSVLWPNNLYAVQAICPMVGIVGLTLGGGYGFFNKLFGLVLDNVIEMEMVDANGNLLVANESTNEDLFWALRGGGGGNFGIVTKLKFKIYQGPESITYATYTYSFNDFIQFFTALQSLIRSLPNNVDTRLNYEGERINMKLIAFNGRNPQNLEDVSVATIENYQTLHSFPPLINATINVMTPTEFILQYVQSYSSTPLTQLSQLAEITDSRSYWEKIKGIYVEKFLNETEIPMLYDLLKIHLKNAGMGFDFSGGAVNHVSPSATAFVHRGNHLYHMLLRPLQTQNDQPNAVTVATMKSFFEATKPILDHRESYQNYLDEDIEDYLTRYYGDNLQRLKNVKTMYDPDNVFYHPQSIPVNTSSRPAVAWWVFFLLISVIKGLNI